MNGVLGSQVLIRIEIRLRYYLVILLMECFAKMECLNILDCPDILECLDKSEWLNILGCPHRSKDLYRLELLDRPEILDWLDLMYWLVVGKYPLYQLWRARGGWVGGCIWIIASALVPLWDSLWDLTFYLRFLTIQSVRPGTRAWQ